MKQNNKFVVRGGHDYESPAVMLFDIQVEGVLCMSSPASTIDNAVEDDWGTL